MGGAPSGVLLEPPSSEPEEPEQRIIDRLVDATRDSGPAVPMRGGDDCAWLPSGEVVTVDTLVEGVHFDAHMPPEDLGFKAVAVSVSDVAAMGLRPTWAVLSLSCPSPVDTTWVDAFARGVGAACARWSIALVGGDTTRGPAVSVTVTLAGGPGKPVLRSTGRAGDDLWVTGTLGVAALGYLSDAPPTASRQALRRPDPPLEFAVHAAPLMTAAMDISDGLRVDLPRLCRASGVGAWVSEDSLPGHEVFEAEPALARRAKLAGGDDYQLLFAAAPEHRDALMAVASEQGVRITRIGALTPGSQARLASGDWPPPWSHFGGAS